ncbi:related to putative multidrug transporter [Cephalotrichum gorgonifer]|uniref:Related to putative multidrug transporter n=1 Tax=Cephalotrichum gorgonifer TaxID=2041049 RepID=A0AAE8N577_9PEZI|nr:related to putative multidrug transporter [Cephalotrichum gorgonifer]
MYLAYKHYKKKAAAKKQSQALPAAGPNSEHGLPQAWEAGAPYSNGLVVASPTDPTEKSNSDEKELTPEEVAAKKAMRKYRWKIIMGLAAPFLLQALDTTIIASALPSIAQDFGELKQLNWIISSFNLTTAAFMPFWAQMVNIFGRHVCIHATLVVMIIGSAICTGAPNTAFGVLLLGRALQGVGAAGITITVRTILADRVSLSDASVNWTLFAIIASIGFSIGPVIGGYLTTASWRWCFAINLPVAVLAIVLVLILLRKELIGPQALPELEGYHRHRSDTTRHGRFLLRIATIDYGGQMLFLWGIGLLILALTWGGSTHGWSSATVLAPLIVGAIVTLAWLLYEYLMEPPRLMSRVFPIQKAMIPWDLLVQRDIGLIFLINFASGMAMFAIMYYMDLYFTFVLGHSSSEAGISLLYFLPGLGVGAYSANFFLNVWPRQTTPILLVGSITSAVGITVLAWAVGAGQVNTVYGMMALTGFGVGSRLNPGTLHGLAYFPDRTAVITCLVSFANPFGGTVGLTLMGAVFNNKIGPTPDDAKEAIKWAYITMVPFMWACVLVTTFLGNVWIRKDGHEVVHGAYLWSLVFGKKLERETISRKEQGTGRLAPLEMSVLSDAPQREFQPLRQNDV